MPINVPTGFNPADKGASTVLDATERVITHLSGGGSSFARSYTKVSSGKHYVEFTRPSDGRLMVGVSSASGNLNQYIGATSASIGLYNGTVYQGGGGAGSLGGTAIGVIGLAIDADARTVRYINATNDSGDIALTLSGDIYLGAGSDNAPTGYVSMNTGQEAFTYSVPSGYTGGFALLSRYRFEGTTLDENGDPASRKIRAYLRSTGALVGEVMSDPTTGAFILAPVPNTTGTHTLIALDDSDLNALVYDQMVPT